MNKRLPRMLYALCLAVFVIGALVRLNLQNRYTLPTLEILALPHSSDLFTRLISAFHQGYYPPLPSWLAILSSALVGEVYRNAAALLLSLPIATSLLILALYRIQGNPRFGWVAAGTYLCLPIVWETAVFPYTDLAMTVSLAAACVFLELGRRNRGWLLHIMAGVFLGLGMLTKWTFVIFAAPWALYAAAEGYGRGNETSSTFRRLLRFLTISLAFFAVFSPWYFSQLHWPSLLQTMGDDPNLLGTGPIARIFSIANMLGRDMFGAWPIHYLFIVWLVALAGILVLGKGKSDFDLRRARIFALAVWLVPMGIVASMPHVEERYLMVMALGLVLIPSFLLKGLQKKTAPAALLISLWIISALFGVVSELSATVRILSDPSAHTTKWYHPEIPKVRQWFFSLAVRDPDFAAEGLASHPIYQFFGGRTTLQWILKDAGAIPTEIIDEHAYADFVQDLRAKRTRFQYLLTNCACTGDCIEINRKFYEDLVKATPNGYQMPCGGTHHKPTGDEPLGDDCPMITRDFEIYSSLDAGDQTLYLWRTKR